MNKNNNGDITKTMSPLLVMLMLVLGEGDSLGTHNSTGGRGKMFNVFQVTNFPNDECTVSDTKVRTTRIWEMVNNRAG